MSKIDVCINLSFLINWMRGYKQKGEFTMLVKKTVPTRIVGFVSEDTMYSVLEKLKSAYPDRLEIMAIGRPGSHSEFNIEVPEDLWLVLLQIVRDINTNLNTARK